MLGPVDLLRPVIEPLVLVLVVVNLCTRLAAHVVHRSQADEGPDAVSRFLPHEVSNVVLLLASFYYTTVEPHGGVVLSTIVLTVFMTDLFEFESRKVEARKGERLDAPKAAVAASMVALIYAGYQSLFFVIEDVWNSIV